MASTAALISGYGALELKRAYQRNMSIGILSASMLLLIIISGALYVDYLNADQPTEIGKPVIPPTVILGAPPTISAQEIPILIQTIQRTQPSFGIPTPVPDEEAPAEVEIATMDDLASMASPEPAWDLDDVGDQYIVIPNLDKLLPPPDSFVAYEEAPIIVENVLPIYPEIARRAGIEGIVWVSVLLDKSGSVRDVRISRESGRNAGFEEAAIEAARLTVWKPAISNGQPVALWVSYKIVFTLKGGN